MRPTPETDALILSKGGFGMTNYEWREHSRKLERERDEAREEWSKASMDAGQLLSEKTKVMAERDEAREALEDWENAAAHVEADHPDELHCGCVPVLRKLLNDARKERDEAQNKLRLEKLTTISQKEEIEILRQLLIEARDK